uniref:Uncharacterized protein n=1 Tax=Glossina pallidipes TaxID=7398 RepID=A0A1A9ZQM8_GLOPL
MEYFPAAAPLCDGIVFSLTFMMILYLLWLTACNATLTEMEKGKEEKIRIVSDAERHFNSSLKVYNDQQLGMLLYSSEELKESFNYGLFCPPSNGKAGKFLDEERRLVEIQTARL